MTDLPPYHTNSDGSHNCTNCTLPIEESFMSESGWIHPRDIGPLINCYETGPEVACPEAANDADPNFYDERGWARA